jgi:pyridoxal/pyridoxine/pyridoxamine kinase
VRIPRLPGVFIGVGDLFTSLSTAWLFNTGGDLRLAMEKSASSAHAVLTRTLAHAHSASSADAQLELQLIQADIENPAVSVVAEVISREEKEEMKREQKKTTEKKPTL